MKLHELGISRKRDLGGDRTLVAGRRPPSRQFPLLSVLLFAERNRKEEEEWCM